MMAFLCLVLAACGANSGTPGGSSEDGTSSSVHSGSESSSLESSQTVSEESESAVSDDGEQSQQTAPSQTTGGTSSAPAQSQQTESSPSSSASASASQSSKEEQKTVTVSLAVSCRKAMEAQNSTAVQLYPDGWILRTVSVTMPQGASVLDALIKACGENGILLRYASGYVSAIGGLGEKDAGGASGWLYGVNGVILGRSASAYTLKDGDVIRWGYTVDGKTM